MAPKDTHAILNLIDVIAIYIDDRRSKNLVPVVLRPHPYEFYLSFDA